MSNDLMIPDEISWEDLYDEVAEQVDLEKIPEGALHAIPYLMAGIPKAEVARHVGVSRNTLRQWLSQYPSMQILVAKGRELAQHYRLSMLEAQFIKALKVSEEILDMPMRGISDDDETGINSKIATAKGQHARFIIDKFITSRKDISITHELGDSVLDANADALDYVAQVVASLGKDEPVDVTYRVIDGNSSTEGPMLDENGQPNFGTFGGLTVDDELGTQCHDCGDWFKSLATHIRKTMKMTIREYEVLYGLEPGTIARVSP